MHKQNTNDTGFTIVELLIVIVVIAVLVAVAIVAYTGIQGRAHDSAVQSDLRNFANKLEIYNAENGNYPIGDSELSGLGLKFTKGSYRGFLSQETQDVLYCHPLSSNNYKYAIVATSKSGKVFQHGGNGTGLFTGAESTSSAPLCASAGSPIPDATGGSRTFLMDYPGVWKSYTGS